MAKYCGFPEDKYDDVFIILDKMDKNGQEIAEYLEESGKDSSIYITVSDLKYLQRSGRLGSTSAFLGSLLNIKPILTIQGEKIDAFAKCA